MDTFTVEPIAAPVAGTDLDGLIGSLAGLWRDDAGRHDPTVNPSWPHETGAAYLHDLAADSDAVLLAARSSKPGTGPVVGHLVGRFRARNDFRVVPSAELESMQVDAGLRGHGVGSLLVGAFLAECARRGSVRVTVTANAGNTAAQAFYRRHGFEPATVTFVRRHPIDTP